MTLRRIVVDRIALNLEGLSLAQAEFLATQLQAAMAAQAFRPSETGPDGPAGDEMRTSLTGAALVTAVAARLAGILAASPETTPWP